MVDVIDIDEERSRGKGASPRRGLRLAIGCEALLVLSTTPDVRSSTYQPSERHDDTHGDENSTRAGNATTWEQ